jgi:putative addiction module component (TIGR02574 family)
VNTLLGREWGQSLKRDKFNTWPNKALHQTAIPFRCIAAGELGRSKQLKTDEIRTIIYVKEGGHRKMIGKTDILRLSVSERIQLVQDIWDSIAEVPDSIPLTNEQKAELDRRLDAYHKDPNAGSPWSIIRERFKSRG